MKGKILIPFGITQGKQFFKELYNLRHLNLIAHLRPTAETKCHLSGNYVSDRTISHIGFEVSQVSKSGPGAPSIVDVFRNRNPQVDATSRKRRPCTQLTRTHLRWFRSDLSQLRHQVFHCCQGRDIPDELIRKSQLFIKRICLQKWVMDSSYFCILSSISRRLCRFFDAWTVGNTICLSRLRNLAKSVFQRPVRLLQWGKEI